MRTSNLSEILNQEGITYRVIDRKVDGVSFGNYLAYQKPEPTQETVQIFPEPIKLRTDNALDRILGRHDPERDLRIMQVIDPIGAISEEKRMLMRYFDNPRESRRSIFDESVYDRFK